MQYDNTVTNHADQFDDMCEGHTGYTKKCVRTIRAVKGVLLTTKLQVILSKKDGQIDYNQTNIIQYRQDYSETGSITFTAWLSWIQSNNNMTNTK